MARPTKPDHERKTRRINFVVTDIEGAQFEQAAKAHGLGLSEFFRRLASNARLPSAAVDRQAQAEATTALLRLGVNLNQIAKHVNAGRAVPDGKLADLITRIHSAMDTLDESGDRGTRQEL